MCLCARLLALEWKGRAFIEKVNSRCFCWFPAAILVHQNGAPIWRLHTKLYKGAWNVSPNNSETMGHKDLRLGQIVYTLVFYNISFSWALPLDGFQVIFFVAWQWKPSILWFILRPPPPSLSPSGNSNKASYVNIFFKLFSLWDPPPLVVSNPFFWGSMEIFWNLKIFNGFVWMKC